MGVTRSVPRKNEHSQAPFQCVSRGNPGMLCSALSLSGCSSGVRAEQPAAADAFQPPLRCGFQARLSRSVRQTDYEVD
jgi:hypothetical protein